MGKTPEDTENEETPKKTLKVATKIQNGHALDLASVRFPLWDYDADGLVQTLGEILEQSGVRSHWQIPQQSLTHFLMQIRSNYQENPYHNFRHAFCVTQIVYSLLKTLSSDVNLDLDCWGVLLIAAIAHDVDHPGVTNSFLISSTDALCALYGEKSTLEHHHFTTLCTILHKRQCDILVNVLNRKYEILRRIRELILVTDLAQQPGFIRAASHKLQNSESLSQSETLKLVLKCADISNEVRPPEISQPIIDSLYEEMFLQGRLEKERDLPRSPSFDELTVSKEEQQKQFHSHFTLPLFRLLSKAFPATKTPYLDILEEVAQKYNVDSSAENS